MKQKLQKFLLGMGLTYMVTIAVGQPYAPDFKKAEQPGSNYEMANADGKKYTDQFLQRGLRFTENKGQVTDLNGKPLPGVLFTAQNDGVKLFLTGKGISYQFLKPATHLWQGDVNNAELYRLDLELVGSNKNPSIQRFEAGNDVEHFVNHANNGSILGVKNYGRIVMKNIYPNVDWVIYTKGHHLEYDFVVHPGGNPKSIKLKYTGAPKNSILKDGSLLVSTPLGDIKELSPVLFQSGKEKGHASFKKNNDLFGFEVSGVDYSQSFTIDPVVVWGSYFSGAFNSSGMIKDITTDEDGNIYAIGTYRGDGLSTTGVHQTVNGGLSDIVLAKFDADGNRIWSTYYGGVGNDEGNGISMDGVGNLIIAGTTNSPTGLGVNGLYETLRPDVTGGYNTTDALLAKFTPAGTFMWGTYLGGSGSDLGQSCAVDAGGNIYLGGLTNSSSEISTSGAYKEALSGTNDAFLIKISPSGNALLWGTYFGGDNTEELNRIAISSTSIIIGGKTDSENGIGMNGFQNNKIGYNTSNGYLAKFNLGGQLEWSTYTGKSKFTFCSFDQYGNILFTGDGSGGYDDFPGFLERLNVMKPQSFPTNTAIGKLSSNGSFLWGSVFKTSGGGNPVVFAFNEKIYYAQSVIGGTLPGSGGIKTNTDGIDVLLASIKPENGTINWSTYYGGESTDEVLAIGKGKNNGIILAGKTTSASGIKLELNPVNTSPGLSPSGFISFFNDVEDEQKAWYPDVDDDGFGNSVRIVYSVTKPDPLATGIDKWLAIGGDCNDVRRDFNPDANEIWDNLDNNCNGIIDEGFPTKKGFYQDKDRDGFGDKTTEFIGFYPPLHPRGMKWVDNGLDCNDADIKINPEAREIPRDGIDQNCNGSLVDTLCIGEYDWFLDSDFDGFGGGLPKKACYRPSVKYSRLNGDCNDNNSSIYPGALELDDNLDNDCDGNTDNNKLLGYGTLNGLRAIKRFFIDKDGDGKGAQGGPIVETTEPFVNGYVQNNDDCDDNDPTKYEGAFELPDGKDNNCNGMVDEGLDCRKEWFPDRDFDSWGQREARIYMGCVTPVVVPEGLKVPNALVTRDGDCNNRNARRNPGATEICDGVDNDCDGLIDEGCTSPVFSSMLTAKQVTLAESEKFLTNAFPNPHDGSFIIEVQSPAAGKGSIVLYDLQGRTVATREEQLQKGTNQVRFSNMKRMNYMYRVLVNGQSTGGKILSVN